MHVGQLWRYPVKSMIGEPVDAVELGELGIVGDRVWATRDLERGGIRGAKKIGALMQFAAAALPDGNAAITFPDGTLVSTADHDASERLSAVLGHTVRLEALRPADDLEHYRRGRPDTDDVMGELRAIFGRVGDEPIPDLSLFPAELAEFESPPGTYYDAYPLMVMSSAALAALRAAVPGSIVDVRRFRPSMVIDTGDEAGHPELSWTGRRAAVGSCEIEFLAPCPRCVMITRKVDDDVPADRAILRHVVAALGQNLGVYARVVTTGRVAVGDELTFR